MEIALVDGAISVERQRNVEIADLVSVGEACDLVDRAVVASLRLFRVLDHFVDEVAEVQDESELIVLRRAFVLEDHPAIGVEAAFIDGLAADEGEVDRSRVELYHSDRISRETCLLRLSKRTEYGLRAAVQLARLWPRTFVQSRDLAQVEDLPSNRQQQTLKA